MWNLRGLYLSFNRLKEIPEEIGLLSLLERLYLNFNNIVTLPPKISTIVSLVRLDLKGNPLDASLKKKLREDGTKALLQYLRAEAAKLVHLHPTPLAPPSAQPPSTERKKSLEKPVMQRSPSEPIFNNAGKNRNLFTKITQMFSKNSTNSSTTDSLPPRPVSPGTSDPAQTPQFTINNLPPPPPLKRITSLQPSALPVAPLCINPRRQSLPNIRPKTKQNPNAELKMQGQLTLLEQKEKQFKELKSSYTEVEKVEADTMSQENLIIKANDLTKRIAQSSEFMIELLKQREALKQEKVSNDTYAAELIKSIEQH